MISYMCKYAPIEILEAFGTPVAIMDPHVTNFTQADTLMHPNMCSFVKAVLEDFENGNYEGMIFTTCCDSSRRLYDTLCRCHPEKFFFCFDLPRKVNEFSVSLYLEQMEELIREYAEFSGKVFDPERLADICGQEFEMQLRKKELQESGMIPEKKADLRICLAGARPGAEIKQLIEDKGARIALDLTCTGITREYEIYRNDILRSYAKSLLGQVPCMRMSCVSGRKEMLSQMAGELDGIIYHTVKFCDIYSYEYTGMKAESGLPMVKLETDATSQGAGQILTRVEAFLESLRARKAHECGGRKTEGSHLGTGGEKKKTGRRNSVNAQKNENCLSENDGIKSREVGCKKDKQMSGQMENKLELCRACYQGADTLTPEARLTKEDVAADSDTERDRGLDTRSKKDSSEDSDAGKAPIDAYRARNHAGGDIYIGRKGDVPMFVMGIDSGSTSTNAVIINEKKEILASAVVRTGAKSGESAERILKEVLEKANLAREDISEIVSTGYGRVSIPFADRNVTEISCHGKGAHHLNPKVRTILDIGGQDSKAIRLNERGDVVDFVMNDKCAAGTGRFLEMMARTLEIGIDELGPISLKSRENVEISSMCSVFAESEVISLIAQNKETADIARGIHRAIAGKAVSLLKRVGLEKDFMMTGGVAKNPGVVKVLEEMLGAPLYIYEEPEIVGALGAALYGLES